jgi:hypothetical protein
MRQCSIDKYYDTCERVAKSESYEAALAIIGEHVELIDTASAR